MKTVPIKTFLFEIPKIFFMLFLRELKVKLFYSDIRQKKVICVFQDLTYDINFFLCPFAQGAKLKMKSALPLLKLLFLQILS